MKRFCKYVLFLFLFIALTGATITGQENPQYFSRTYFVLRVAPHNLGYRVMYQTEAGESHIVYLPIDWFKAAGGKATIQAMWHTSGPHMQVFWKDGEFSHLRLVVSPSYSDQSWSVVPQGVDVNTAFNVDELNLHY